MFGQFSGESSPSSPSFSNQDNFCFTVSLHDATTLHVTNRITMILGYPEDMLKGQCILNYLYPRDRPTFASHLSQGLQSRFAAKENKPEDKIVFYVRIREYKGLGGGFRVAERSAVYKPFQLTCVVKDVILGKQDNPKPANEEISTICFIASASPIVSAHKVPNEKNPAMTPFASRHTSSCHYSHIDTSSIPYLGYLPQDIVGYSVFDFYHHDDLHLIRDIYGLVVREEGAPFRSKPYRFRVFNGDYITLETDWSSFINPWSRSMEFVIGHHRIIDGPSNPDVFCEPESKGVILENHSEKQRLQEEVRNMLSKPIKHHFGKIKPSKRKHNLAAFVSSIIDGMEVASLSGQECSSDQESVVMGEISPHQDDSDISPETPLSFQQTRLQENIERFFASQPKTNCLPSFSSAHSSSTTQNSSPCGSGSNDDSLKHQQTYTSSMDSGINANSSSGFDRNKKGDQTATTSMNESSTSEDKAIKEKNVSSKAVTKYPEHYRKSRNSTGNDHESPINPNCVSLTEDVLSQHNKIISKRMGKQTGHMGCLKTPKKMDAAKFKRTCSSSESNSRPKPKQACYHSDERDHFNRKSTPNTLLDNQSMAHLNLKSNVQFGIPVILNQSFQTCDEATKANSKDNPSCWAPHLLMPLMYIASPIAICSPNETSDQVASYNVDDLVFNRASTGKNKRSVKLQTDLFHMQETVVETAHVAIPKQDIGSKNCVYDDSNCSAGCSVSTCSYSEETSSLSEKCFSNEIRSKTIIARSHKSRLNSSESYDNLSMKYQIPLSGLEFTLKKDLALLETMEQPDRIKQQLVALFEEFNDEEKSKIERDKAKLEEAVGFNTQEEQIPEVGDKMSF